MANLKEKILHALIYNKQVDMVLDDLSISQENLLKNYSNPAIKQKDKNKILKKFNTLKNIEKSIYRFNKLSENDYSQDAEEEKENVETVVLKGGISYNKYVWHSENSEDTCDICKSLDGQEFDFYEEVPKRPHPNCKCIVEIIEETNSNDNSETYTIENDNTTKVPSESQNPQTSAPQSTSKTPHPNPVLKVPQQTQPQKWIKPCIGPITSPYGWRTHPVHGTKKFHDGIDIGVQLYTPIQAPADGIVIVAKWYNGYGNYIEIDHGNGVHSFYGHLSSFNVKIGDKITQGKIIGKSGNTGIGTGAHLHFGVHKNGQRTNPLDFFTNF